MMWNRLIHRRPAPPPRAPHRRDPDLDRVRVQQHDLINRVASDQLRADLRARRIETIEDVWRRRDAGT